MFEFKIGPRVSQSEIYYSGGYTVVCNRLECNGGKHRVWSQTLVSKSEL